MFVRPGAILLSEVIGALSYALDITEGEPPGHAARSCMIGMRLAEELRLDAETRSDLFYALLLKDAGCTANAAQMAALFGADDHQAKHSAKRIDWARPFSAFVWSVKTVAPGRSPRARLDRLLAIKDEGEVTRSLMQARCDRGAEIALMIGLSRDTAEAIRTLDEHWDGRGQPLGLAGDQIPLLGRILCLAQTVEIFHAEAASTPPTRSPPRRSRGWFDPGLVEALEASGTTPASGPRSPSPTSPAGSRRTRCSRSTTIACCRSPRLRGDRRREVALDVRPLGPDECGRDRDRGGARVRRGRDRATCATSRCCTTSASSRSPAGSSTSPPGSPTPSTRA